MASRGPKLPKPPAGLKAPGRAFWTSVNETFVLDEPILIVLASACRELDREDAANRLIEKEGLIIEGGDGRKYPHPCVLISRDARAAFVRTVRMLKLDVEPLNDGPGRPLGAGR